MVNVMLAGAFSMAIALLCTPLFITFLVRRRYGQFIRDDLTHHHVKRGKPTMAGAVIRRTLRDVPIPVGVVVVGVARAGQASRASS